MSSESNCSWSLNDKGAGFGAFTFYARQHGTEECDARGLPLTPNSIIMMGNFQELKTISHFNLCKYLDFIKCASEERVMCVSEHYQDNLENYLAKGKFSSFPSLGKLSYQILSGLEYLHKNNIVVTNLSPVNVLLTAEEEVKIFNYGLFHLTSKGEAVRFPIGSPRYLAPEILLTAGNSKHESVSATVKSDIWSFGIILLELVMKSHVYPNLFLKNGLKTLFTRIISLAKNEQKNSIPPLQTLLEMHSQNIKQVDQLVLVILQGCLTCLPSARRTAPEILDLLKEYRVMSSPLSKRNPFHKNGFRADDLNVPAPPSQVHTIEQAQAILSENHLSSWDIKDIYFLWCLAGGDVKAELSKQGLICARTPILTVPSLVGREGGEFGINKAASVNLFDERVVSLPLEQLKSRLAVMSVKDYYPILANPETVKQTRRHSLKEDRSVAIKEASILPLLIKEKDIEYQFHRVVLYRLLLEGYPYTREMIVSEAVTDICSHYRGPIWASILNVKGDILTKYTNIDKDTETQTDRQIAVDIPRCHQYDLLLASRQGHLKFKRVLKAWVASHPHLVYWQGLDSLCAPFIALNFNNEALAYSCLCAFIDKFLMDFFKHKNSELMQEYLSVFSHVIAYHDPELFNHLDRNMFYPDLYAIPWFLTMFTHVFPLNKIYHLWDTLLLGNPSFPLFAGLSILSHLRTELFATSDFSECITMFSDMPDVDIQQCTQNAIAKYRITPSSLCVRQFDSQPIQHPSIPEEARKKPLPLETLKAECSPQISAHDVMTLCRLERKGAYCYKDVPLIPSMDPDNPLLWKKLEGVPNKEMEGVIVDIRSEEEFRLDHVRGSINLPAKDEISAEFIMKKLEPAHGKIVIIVGNASDPGASASFARILVDLNVRYVCVLHGGAGVLRSMGLMNAY